MIIPIKQNKAKQEQKIILRNTFNCEMLSQSIFLFHHSFLFISPLQREKLLGTQTAEANLRTTKKITSEIYCKMSLRRCVTLSKWKLREFNDLENFSSPRSAESDSNLNVSLSSRTLFSAYIVNWLSRKKGEQEEDIGRRQSLEIFFEKSTISRLLRTFYFFAQGTWFPFLVSTPSVTCLWFLSQVSTMSGKWCQ